MPKPQIEQRFTEITLTNRLIHNDQQVDWIEDVIRKYTIKYEKKLHLPENILAIKLLDTETTFQESYKSSFYVIFINSYFFIIIIFFV